MESRINEPLEVTSEKVAANNKLILALKGCGKLWDYGDGLNKCKKNNLCSKCSKLFNWDDILTELATSIDAAALERNKRDALEVRVLKLDRDLQDRNSQLLDSQNYATRLTRERDKLAEALEAMTKSRDYYVEIMGSMEKKLKQFTAKDK